LDSTNQAAVAALVKKRDAAARLKSRYQNQLRGLTASASARPAGEAGALGGARPDAASSAGDLAKPTEAVFSAPVATAVREEHTRRADRSSVFPGLRGLHSAYDKVKRVDLKLVVTEQIIHVETLTDPHTGKAVRACLDDVGPARSNLTWGAIATVIQLVVGFAVATNRLMLIVGHKAFSSGRICGLLQWAARHLVPVYVFLGESLGDADVLAGDDTPTKIIDLATEIPEDDPLGELDERFGFKAARADGKGEKKTLNVSLITGRTKADEPKSTIHFFRTHLGNFGNLLSRILESRKPTDGPLTLQGDLSSANLPSKTIRQLVAIIMSGCGAHARRPFWRYRADDPVLCFYMLSCFFLLARLERLIDVRGRTPEVTLRLRQRYGRKIWELIKVRAQAALTGGEISGGRAIRWPPKTALHLAANYIIDHYPELTRYLDDPRLEFTNNARERGLRAEVYMLLASKFRKTRRGRAALDVLRTINATCTTAEIALADYLREVLPAGPKIATNPAHYTPYAVAERLRAARATSATPAA
jgi:hypothetical protein